MFSLPPDKVYVQGEGFSSVESLHLRVAVQGGNGGQIIAMSTVAYEELKITVRQCIVASSAFQSRVVSLVSSVRSGFHSWPPSSLTYIDMLLNQNYFCCEGIREFKVFDALPGQKFF